MKFVRVNIPFTDKVTGKQHNANDEIELSDQRIAEVRMVNINMVTVLSEAPEKKLRKKKAE